MEQRHVDAFCTFGVTMHLVCGQDQVKVLPILLLLPFADRSCLQPGIVSTAGYTGDLAQFFDG